MKAPFSIGSVGHFGLAVRDPRASAAWYVEMLGCSEQFTYEEGVAVGTAGVTIALFRGTPSPATIDHVSFHLEDRKTLEAALEYLKRKDVPLEDPGSEIGPEAPGSKNIGLWLHDPDGYRIELSVLG